MAKRSLKSSSAVSTEDSTHEPLKVVEAIYKFNEEYASHKIQAYTTDVAGLVVCKTHRIKHDLLHDSMDLVVVSGSWDILLYPFGEQILSGFKTKADAVAVCEHELKDFKWVSFYESDIKKQNDMTKVREAIMGVKKVYGV